MKTSKSAGFTIVELMIAMLVFAVVLILITTGVLNFTQSYFKGINQSRTQTAARSVIETIAQAVQFSGGDVNGMLTETNDAQGFCIGNQRYSFLKGKQLTESTPAGNQSQRVLVVDEPGNCSGGAAHDITADMPSGGRELLTPGMRVSKLTLERQGVAGDLYKISVRVVYGDDDLLCSPSAGDCDSTAPTDFNANDLSCRFAFQGAQYCAYSELSTTVKKRISATP